MEIYGKIGGNPNVCWHEHSETGACASSINPLWVIRALTVFTQEFLQTTGVWERVTVSIQFYTNWSLWGASFFAAHCCAMSAEHNLPTALMHELQVTRLGIKAIRPGDVDMVALVAATLLLGKLFWNILNYFETAWRSEAASKHPKKICEIKTAQDMQDLSAIGT